MLFLEWFMVPFKVALIAVHASVALVEVPLVEAVNLAGEPVDIHHQVGGEVILHVDLNVDTKGEAK